MYILYKLVQVLLLLDFWIFACLIGAWVLLGSPPRLLWARRLLFLGILLLYVVGIRPTGEALIGPLERHYPPVSASASNQYDAVVVLSGGSGWEPQTEVGTILGTASLDRLVCGMILVRKGTAPTLVLSGGVGDPFGRNPSEADTMREFAVELGVPATAIVTEAKSRHTAESAVEVRRMLRNVHRIVLVTSAEHLVRSTALFRKQGFEVTPYPCTYLTSASNWSPLDFFPNLGRVGTVNAAIHEYAGIAVYKVMGRL